MSQLLGRAATENMMAYTVCDYQQLQNLPFLEPSDGKLTISEGAYHQIFESHNPIFWNQMFCLWGARTVIGRSLLHWIF